MGHVVHPLLPEVFSLPNLRNASQSGGRGRAKSSLLQIAEHFAGVGEDFEIPQFVETYPDLVDLLKWFHKALHKDSFKTKMPPKWDCDGHFELKWSVAEIDGVSHAAYPHLVIKSSQACLPLPRKELPEYHGPGTLRLDKNFSRRNAMIGSTIPGCDFGLP